MLHTIVFLLGRINVSGACLGARRGPVLFLRHRQDTICDEAGVTIYIKPS
jgi:hypothetical protein